MSTRFLGVLFLLLASGSGMAQEADLTIIVRAGDTGGPLGGALLEVGGVRGAADMVGRAELSGVPPGPLRISASSPGYVTLDTTVTVVTGESNLAILSLRSDARDLGDVVVEAESVNDALLRRRGFFERRERNTGVFLTRQELDQRGTTMFSDVFRAIPGVRVQRQGQGGRTSIVSQRRRGCEMALFFDGVEMAYGALNADAISYDDIAAVEVYRGPSEVPSEYNYTRSRETCGAVLIWTRMVAAN